MILYKEMGHRHGTAEALAALGKVVAAQSDYAAARKLYEESLTISRALGEQWVIAVGLVGLGEVVAAQGAQAWAAQLWGAAEALRDRDRALRLLDRRPLVGDGPARQPDHLLVQRAHVSARAGGASAPSRVS